jgi:hypothetical protein
MKKFLALGALALAVAAFPQQQASAWKNSCFSIGLNWNTSSGGNNLMWGVFRNGQPGECEMPNCPGHIPGGQYGHGYQQPFGHGYEGHPQPYGPGYDGGFVPPMPAPGPVLPAPGPMPAPGPVPHAYWYGQPAYQAVNYAPTYPGSYYTPVNWYGR